ncbi:sterol desaturase family protein [Pollutibacter soli]|uniref:sterol desaturase family protein n=1 Tax=Pollutibacter soli TaxID=3034157 RepID=UPI003013C6D9
MWQSILDHFNTLEQRPVERLAIIVGGLLILWMIEGAIPLMPLRYRKSKVRHASVNLAFTVIHLIIHTGFGVLIVLLSDWTKTEKWGIVHWLHLSLVGTIIVSALVLDFFGGWFSHITEHKIPLFWRMHIIHHSDTNVDVTTGLRHHPLESVWRGLFFLMGILVSGSPIYAVMIYQTILTVFVAFTHANISLPLWLDKSLSFLMVSPNMHKVHHHWKQPFTDSNYGAVFSIWDRMFGTFRTMKKEDIRYGLDRYYPEERDEDFGYLMKKPFLSLLEKNDLAQPEVQGGKTGVKTQKSLLGNSGPEANSTAATG